MKGAGQAVSHGAISILNAFSTGKGGALGVNLWTRAKVTLRDGPGGVSGFVTSDPQESTKLVVRVVEKTLGYYGYEKPVSGEVITTSNIPVAVGLKSSSAAANATALATASALGEGPEDDALVNLAVDASIETGVSLTGAYDDSYTSYHGGAVVTDNLHRKVEKVIKIPDGLRILILVPHRKTHTGTLDKDRFRSIRKIGDVAYREASNGRLWEALTLNGLAVSSVLGEDPRPALSALEAGALGAGLTGKGPATVAVVEDENAETVRKAFSQFDANILEALPNQKKAEVEQ